MNEACLGCNSERLGILVDFGPQPPSNRFMRPHDCVLDNHPLRLAQCPDCALVQLYDPMPPRMVKSHFEWISYNEPEEHLDDLANQIKILLSHRVDSKIFGITWKDDSTLYRLKKLGFSNSLRFDLEKDLGLKDACAGLESIQQVFDEDRIKIITSQHGRADLIVARHLVEHAHDPARLMSDIRSLLNPGGYLVLEVPDCTKFISSLNYIFVWEEHISYFSPVTLSSLVSRCGYSIFSLLRYSYSLEDSLILILAPKEVQAQKLLDEKEIIACNNFGKSFVSRRNLIQNYLVSLHNKGKRIAIFGAGHLAVKFINFFNLGTAVHCVIDDNPRKQGLFMPGSNLPILGSDALLTEKIDLCLLSLNPESEAKVLKTMQAFVASGLEFASIFQSSPISLKIE